jgi:EAL domain-containing protein (putative c-di-GMP-specific phosphodiesterase class I)
MSTRPIPAQPPQAALPGLPVALSEIPLFTHGADGSGLGVITFVVHPDTAFYRLSPESALRLRQEITHRLNEQLRETDRLYSISSREWLIVLPGLRSSATLSMAMLKLQHMFDEKQLSVDGITLRLPVSCGAAIYPDDGDDALHLVQSARIAGLHAERSGEASALYDPRMEELDDRLKDFDHELQQAFSGDSGLRLHLQPQIETLSGRCGGAEALLRWRRGNGEWVSPLELLAAIERLGLRHRFNRWLFLTAGQICHQLALSEIGIMLSVNLSANDLLDPEVPDLLAQALDTWNVDPSAIQLEITETSVVKDADSVSDVLLRLRQLGVSLSIDDFGTGFSGMSNLQILPVQEVKVDQSFIRNIVDSKRDQEITESIIRLAHRLELQVVAEGVETRAAADLLAAMGCEWLQGFLYAPALPLEQFIAWYQTHEAANTAQS